MVTVNPRTRDKIRPAARPNAELGYGIRCPNCGSGTRLVVNSRPTEAGHIRRRSRCIDCECRYTTYEIPAESAKDIGAGDPLTIVDTFIPGWAALTVADRAFVRRIVTTVAGRRDVPEEHPADRNIDTVADAR